MDLVSVAYAQTAPAVAEASVIVPPIVFVAIGFIVTMVALGLVFRNIPVTSGHSIFLGAGIALMVVPAVATFEWSDKGFKISMKNAAEDLAAQTAFLSKENKEIREELLRLNNVLQTTVSKLGEVTAPNQPAPSLPTSGPDSTWEQIIQPDFYRDFEVRNKSAVQLNQQNLDSVLGLQESLKSLPGF